MDNKTLCIRLATADDLHNIKTCARLAYTKYLARMDRHPAPMVADFARQIALEQIYVATSGSLLSGFVVFYKKSDHIHLENIAVIPESSGKSIGKALIEFVEQCAHDAGINAVELYTNEVMTENIAIYTKLGYVETERKREDGFNRVYFRKLL